MRNFFQDGFEAAFEKLGMRASVHHALKQLGPEAEAKYHETKGLDPSGARRPNHPLYEAAQTPGADPSRYGGSYGMSYGNKAMAEGARNVDILLKGRGSGTDSTTGAAWNQNKPTGNSFDPNRAAKGILPYDFDTINAPGEYTRPDRQSSDAWAHTQPDVSTKTRQKLPEIGEHSAGNNPMNEPKWMRNQNSATLQKMLAGSGDIDWRPQETTPEDMYAMPSSGALEESGPLASNTWENRADKALKASDLPDRAMLNYKPESKPQTRFDKIKGKASDLIGKALPESLAGRRLGFNQAVITGGLSGAVLGAGGNMLHERLTKDEGDRDYGQAAIRGGLRGGFLGGLGGLGMTGRKLPGR